MNDNRFSRQIALFGDEGQQRLKDSTIAIVGLGGVGSVVLQNLALAGVGQIAVIDHDELENTNRNRHVCAEHNDVVPGSFKVDIAKRLIHRIDPSILIYPIRADLRSTRAFDVIKSSQYVFGCVDSDGPRLILNELCNAYEIRYYDLATDIHKGPPALYGGRFCADFDDCGCLVCHGLLDIKEATVDLETPAQRRIRDSIYGVPLEELGGTGPSVVTINTVVAGLGTTEFLRDCTGLGPPNRVLMYYGHMGIVTKTSDPPRPGCLFCKAVRGSREDADVERYIRESEST